MIRSHLVNLSTGRSRLSSAHRTLTRRLEARHNHSPAPPSKSDPLPSSARVQRYMPRLQDLSRRTGVPISSLVVSFMILHELTAVLPVIGFYFLFSSLGTGLGIIQWLNRTTETGCPDEEDGQEATHPNGWRGWVKGWYDEGEAKIGKVGKRYGLWQDENTDSGSGVVTTSGGRRAGEGVANAISAYVVVKALLPVRIGVSLGAAPVFARWALEPIRNLAKRYIRRK